MRTTPVTTFDRTKVVLNGVVEVAHLFGKKWSVEQIEENITYSSLIVYKLVLG